MYERLPLEHPGVLQFLALVVIGLVFLTCLVLLADRSPASSTDVDPLEADELEGGPR